eukprot:4857027-Prymnesium_polylepis.1
MCDIVAFSDSEGIYVLDAEGQHYAFQYDQIKTHFTERVKAIARETAAAPARGKAPARAEPHRYKRRRASALSYPQVARRRSSIITVFTGSILPSSGFTLGQSRASALGQGCCTQPSIQPILSTRRPLRLSHSSRAMTQTR